MADSITKNHRETLYIKDDITGVPFPLEGDIATGALKITGSISAGIQYTEGDTDTTITGTALMWEDASDTLRPVSAAKPLPISGSVMTQDGSGNNLVSTTTTPSAAARGLIVRVAPGTGAGDIGKAEDDAHNSGDTGVMMLGVRNDAQTTRTSTDGDYSPLATDGAGNVFVVPSSATGSAAPTKAFMVGGSDGTNLRALTTGTDGKLIVRLQDSSANPLQVSTPGDAMAAAPTTTLGATAFNAVYNGTDYVRQRGDTTGTYTVSKPTTSGGLSMHKTISAASTNATSVKASAGQLYGIQVYNTNASARYLKLYNKASAPTVGTDTPVKVITIPGSTAGAGSNVNYDGIGVAFSAGIAFALTTGAADSDTGAVAANEIVVNLDYF